MYIGYRYKVLNFDGPYNTAELLQLINSFCVKLLHLLAGLLPCVIAIYFDDVLIVCMLRCSYQLAFFFYVELIAVCYVQEKSFWRLQFLQQWW